MKTDHIPSRITIEYMGAEEHVRALPGWGVKAKPGGVTALTSPLLEGGDISQVMRMIAILEEAGATYADRCYFSTHVEIKSLGIDEAASIRRRIAGWRRRLMEMTKNLGWEFFVKKELMDSCVTPDGRITFRCWNPTDERALLEAALRFTVGFVLGSINEAIPESPDAYEDPFAEGICPRTRWMVYERQIEALKAEIGMAGVELPGYSYIRDPEIETHGINVRKGLFNRADGFDDPCKKFLKRNEIAAMRYYREIDWRNFDPGVIVCKDAQEDAWRYWRMMISSDALKNIMKPKTSCWFMVIDKVSKGILGVFSIDAPLANMGTTGQRTVTLGTCLPTQPFGRLCGGKLMAMMASSSQVLKMYEKHTGLVASALVIPTKDGITSQYNRLRSDGIEFYAPWKRMTTGFYMCETRKGGIRCIKGEIDYAGIGKMKRPRLEYMIGKWFSRWYRGRYERIGSELPAFDRSVYSYNVQMRMVEDGQSYWGTTEG